MEADCPVVLDGKSERDLTTIPAELIQRILLNLPIDANIITVGLSSRRVFAPHLLADVSFARSHFRFQFHQSATDSIWDFMNNTNIRNDLYLALPFTYQVAIFAEILKTENWAGNQSCDWEIVGFDNHLMTPERWVLTPENSLKRMQRIYSRIFDFDPSSNEDRAIRWAAIDGHINVVRLLLQDKRVDAAARQSSALIEACGLGHLDIVELLMADARCNPSEFENYAIWKAAKMGRIEIVRLLIQDSRVDPTVFDQIPLKLAIQENHANIVRMLLDDYRVDPASQSNWSIRNACEYGRLEIIQMLLQHPKTDPCDLNNSALKLAVQENQLKAVEILLEDGRADPASENDWCLHFSAIKGNAPMIQLLLKDSRVSVSMRTILAAIENRNSECADILALHKKQFIIEDYVLVV
ncbi:hypothetical protein HK100_004290 [Physocladia obscura]|uniref:Uncharacterized protein n=1 Tax=Physocladia obscura TaxID=109957 RepID=A0AAD5ST96_9FUNG|nr:hypothetical protein HK100_004290 [Physocladia obscura]